MSNCIKTRNAFQCRSHHQKMVTKFKSIEGVLSNSQHLLYRREYGTKTCKVEGQDREPGCIQPSSSADSSNNQPGPLPEVKEEVDFSESSDLLVKK
jgi:hypothetical protein